MKTRLLLPVALGGALFSTVPTAFAEWTPTFPVLPVPVHLFETAGTGAFGESVLGQFGGNLFVDAMTIRDGKLVFVADVDLFGVPVDTPVSVNDIALLAGGGPGGLDACLAVGPAGLTAHWWDDAARAVVTQVVSAVPNAIGAVDLAVGDLDGDAWTDVVLITGDSRTLQPLLGQETGGYAAGTPFTSSGPIHAMTIATVYDSASPIAVADAGGVSLFDLQWNKTVTPFLAASYTDLQPVELSSGTQLVALCSVGAVQGIVVGTATQLDSIIAVPAELNLLSVRTVVLVQGGEPGLLANDATHPDLVHISYTGGMPAYSMQTAFNWIITDMEAFSFAGSGPLVLGDVDGDGDIDGAVTSPSTGEFGVPKNGNAPEWQMKPSMSVTPSDQALSPGGYLIEWGVSAPATIDPSVTHLEVCVYRRAHDAPFADPTPLDHFEIDAAGGFPESFIHEIPAPPLEGVDEYLVVLRMVELDDGELVRGWPSALYGFGADTSLKEGEPIPVNNSSPRPPAGGTFPTPPGG